MPVQLLDANYAYPLTKGQATCILYGCLLVTALLFAVLVMVFSELLRSATATLASAVGFLFMGVNVPEQIRWLAQLWDCLPLRFANVWNVFDERMIGSAHFTAWQAVPVLYLLAVLLLYLVGKPVYTRYQVRGR